MVSMPQIHPDERLRLIDHATTDSRPVPAQRTAGRGDTASMRSAWPEHAPHREQAPSGPEYRNAGPDVFWPDDARDCVLN